MKKITFIISAVLMMSALSSCGERADEVTIDAQQAQGEYIQFDSEGQPYVDLGNGETEYLTVSEADANNELITGDFIGFNAHMKTMDDWYIDLSEYFPVLMSLNDETGSNRILFNTYEGAGYQSADEATADAIKSDYETLADGETFESYTFKGTESLEIGEFPAQEVTGEFVADGKTVIISTYLINDDYGGHIVISIDPDDEINTTDAVNEFFSTISFTDTSEDSSQTE